jgi:hypothetical protein
LREDVDHRRATHVADAEFLEFAEYAGVAPAVIGGDLDDQVADVFRSFGPTGLTVGGFWPLGIVFGDPAPEGAVGNDGDQSVECVAEEGSEFDELSDPLRNFSPHSNG